MLMTLALRGHRLRIKRLVRIAPGAKPGERAADLMGGEDLGDIPACLGRRRGAGESTLRRPRSMLLVGNYQAWTGDLPETREEPVVHPAKDPRPLARARVRTGLAAGGRWIRTIGSPVKDQLVETVLFDLPEARKRTIGGRRSQPRDLGGDLRRDHNRRDDNDRLGWGRRQAQNGGSP